MNRFTMGLIGLTVGASVTLAGGAQADPVADFYKGKTVEMVVSAAPGGGADTLTRMLVDVLVKHIPGQPEQVVLNKPGAGGMVEASRMYVQGDGRGLQISFLQRNNLIHALLNEKHEQFDPRKVNWIGSIKREPYIIAAYKTSPVQKIEDAWEKEMIVGATGFTNENRTLSAMMNEFLGTKFNIISGYKGSRDISLAVEGGELHGWFRSLDGSKYGPEAPLYESGDMKRLLVLQWERHPDVPDVPALGEYVKDESLKPLINFFLLPLQAGRPIAVPGDVPPERVAALRKAFIEATKDPVYVKRMEEQGQSNDPMTGEEVEEVIAQFYATKEELLDKVRSVLIKQKGS